MNVSEVFGGCADFATDVYEVGGDETTGGSLVRTGHIRLGKTWIVWQEESSYSLYDVLRLTSTKWMVSLGVSWDRVTFVVIRVVPLTMV